MRASLRRVLPSMFHRRLLLLGSAVTLVMVVLVAKLAWLTVEPTSAAMRKAKAEAVLKRRSFIPMVRGRILDRHQRVLAYDRASYDVAIHYHVITETWAYDRAWSQAYREHRSDWAELPDHRKTALTAQYLPAYLDQIDELWETLQDLGAVDEEELLHRRAQILHRVQGVRADVGIHRLQRLRQEAEQGERLTLADALIDVAEQNQKHALLTDISAQARLHIERLVLKHQDDKDSVWQEVEVVDSKVREYPYEQVNLMVDRSGLPLALKHPEPVGVTVEGPAIHLIGGLRRIWQEDMERRPFWGDGGEVSDYGGYRLGDLTGSWGIELAQEERLRGLRGERVKDRETGQISVRPPTPGQDVVLSIDIALQAQLEAIMSHDERIGLMRRQPWHGTDLPGELGEPLNGAAVVMDVAQGQVLAAVSMPSFTRTQLREEGSDFWTSRQMLIDRPRVFRPIGGLYEPGSTLKPLVLAAAITSDIHQAGHTIECTGAFDPNNPTVMRCWFYKQYMQTHGDLTGPEAIQHSCNIFFYSLGQTFGAHRLVQWYDRFGFGHVTGTGLPGEIGGALPDLGRADDPNARGFTRHDATFMAIGQGPVGLTPVQIANAYATLARGGYALAPTFLLRSDSQAAQEMQDLRLSAAGIHEAMEGLYLSANDREGTTHRIAYQDEQGTHRERIFDIEDVEVMAKSGTAEATKLRIDANGDGRITRDDPIVREGDHAWVVALVQRSSSPRPDYVVAVVVEYGGSGGRVAGPIVNQILHAMRAEGYL